MKVLIMNPVIGDAYGQEKIIRDSTQLLRSTSVEVHYLTQTIRVQIPDNDGL